MRFEWDERKRAANVRKHGLDFADAPELFRGAMLVAPDDRREYGEDRWLGIGLVRGRAVVVAFAERGGALRIISMRKALTHEREQFERELRDRMGPG